MAYLSDEELYRLGFHSIGKHVQISSKACFYNCANISIGNSVRIDDFCIFSAGQGGIEIGNHIHVAAYTSLIGAGRITLRDFSNLSSRVSIYSSSDDYSGEGMSNPTIPSLYKQVHVAAVDIGRHAIIGCGSVILPGVTLHEGVAIGALSLVKFDCPAFTMHAGSPAKELHRKRSTLLLNKEREFLANEHYDK